MGFCSSCEIDVQDDQSVCPQCSQLIEVGGQKLKPVPSESEADNYATWSLILGVASWTILPGITGIPAIILGHIARTNIEQSAGRLRGNGAAIAGMILGYSSIFAAVVAVLVVVGIRNSTRYDRWPRDISGETNPIANMRILNKAIAIYKDRFNIYPPSLLVLGPGSSNNAEAAGLVDDELAHGRKGGYLFLYARPGGPRDGYSLHANPVTSIGRHYYYSDQSGVIRCSVGNEAGPES